MSFTAEQQKAISALGDTLVSAGAGAGKTRTLVERCVSLLLRSDDPVAIREMLVVTFTEAAAAEVRERIRARLEKAAAEASNDRLHEQLAQLDAAHISTLHSFCFTLVREHFYELDIDPAVSVLDQTQSAVLFAGTLDELMEEHYAGKHEFSGELLEYIRVQLSGWDRPLRDVIRKLHHFTQTRPNPEAWFAEQAAVFSRDKNPEWDQWYREAFQAWSKEWISHLRTLDESNTNSRKCLEILANHGENGIFKTTEAIIERDKCWPAKKKAAHRAEFKDLFPEAKFFHTLAPPGALDQDWDWARRPLLLLIQLARQFGERFARAKRERSVVDFNDLEQFALKLLWDGKPTPLAAEWQKRFRAVFVDEYQDINLAQDCIIRALSSPVAPGNRFLVGDIKQSIYRFRQADPSIFRAYFESQAGWTPAFLAENFRSHEGVLQFVNPLFGWLMKRDLGGVDYDEKAALVFGESPARQPMKCNGEAGQVELHILCKDKSGEADDLDDPLSDLEKTEIEARFVASRLRKMHADRVQIYDQREEKFRTVEWDDMVVLLRSAAGKLEIYAKAFQEMGVPLQTKRDSFYTTLEVLDLCNLLHILDNPQQDIELVAVLRSPLVGLSANELAEIRVASPRIKPFWRALNAAHQSKRQFGGRERVEKFLERYHSWRDARRSASLAKRLETILAVTGYGDWLLGQPNGKQRYANVQQLLRIARQFDEVRGENLYLFLRHLEELQEAAGDTKPPSASVENAVALMTVHQSKGLEFPVVALAGLGNQFNRSDQRSSILFHERYGLCSTIQPPKKRDRYPSLPLWLARRDEEIHAAGEEMRILYVALTRAQNHLLLFGTATEKQMQERWSENAVAKPLRQHITSASSCLDWIGAFLTRETSIWIASSSGSLAGLKYHVHREFSDKIQAKAQPIASVGYTVEQLAATLNSLSFEYAHQDATRQPAKTSVSALRRSSESDDESARVVIRLDSSSQGARRGTAYHTLMEHVDLDLEISVASLHQKAKALETQRILSADEVDLIDFDSVVAFWKSSFAQELLRNRSHIRRELPFTFRLSRSDLAETAGTASAALAIPEGEFVVVQGVADLVVLRPAEIWLLDFKSDAIPATELGSAAERYRSQLALYAKALSSIYRRPVTRKGVFFLSLQEFVWYEN